MQVLQVSRKFPRYSCSLITAALFLNLHRGLLRVRSDHPLVAHRQLSSDAPVTDAGGRAFLTVDDVSPVTSAHACFDALLVPVDHVSRSKTDTCDGAAARAGVARGRELPRS